MSVLSQGISNPIISLPPQMIPLSQKGDAWKKDMADRLEQIGRHQLYNNFSLIENYEIIKGKFIFHHYFETKGYEDMLHNLTKEFDLPKYLRHYDIISQVVNVLSGEYQKRPDNFKVRATDEITHSQFTRDKTRLLLEYVFSQINEALDIRLTEEGYDLNKTDFASEEEAQAYQQELAQRRQALSPPEIEEYMSQSWSTVAEKWGQAELKQAKQKYNLPELERVEFEDMLTSDRCFRHFFLKGDDYGQETWDTITTFFHQTKEITKAEDGDYIGRTIYLTPSAILDRYGWRMNKSDLAKLKRASERFKTKGGIGNDLLRVRDGSIVPFRDYEDYKVLSDASGLDMFNGPYMQDESALDSLLTNATMRMNMSGYWQVTEAYAKCQKRIGKVIYIDPETGIISKALVDERFVPPSYFTELNSSIYDSDEPNTIVWTWVNEVRDFIKINPLFSDTEDCIYLGGDPLPFQFKSDLNPYGVKLPVCGGIFNNRNGQSSSLVDMMKPHQIGYNVAINQLYQLMEREVGRFLLMDVNVLPKAKDWGGEAGWEKFMMVAKGLGIVPIDTSASNMSSLAAGGHLGAVQDLDESARMMSRINIAAWFEQKALSQVGITPQRLGTTAASETATGVQQAVSQSYAQTESYYTRFSAYKKRCYTMNLDIAQYVASKRENVTVSYTKDDMSRAFMQINGTELSLADLGIFVTDSQEDLRQLETIRQLALENNTTGATMVDLADIVMMNSPLQIKAALQKSVDKQEAMQQQAQQIEQQKIQSAQEMQDKQMAFDAEQNQLDREAKLEEAYIKTFGGANNTNTSDIDANAVPDILEYDKFNTTRNQGDRKLDLQERKMQQDAQLASRKEALERDKLTQKRESDAAKIKVAEKNKNQYDKPKK